MEILWNRASAENFFCDFTPTPAHATGQFAVSAIASLAHGADVHTIQRTVHHISPVRDVPRRSAWFDVLDQRRFTVGHERWTAQVAGIHVVGTDTWIQLEFAEDQRQSLLLQLTPETGVGAAVEAIEHSLRRRNGVQDQLVLGA